MHTSMNLLVIYLWMMVSLIQIDWAESDTPAVEEGCYYSQPVLSYTTEVLPKLRQKWYVARVTLRTTLEGGSEPDMNICSIATYMESCKGGIYVEREWSQNGNVKIMTRAYSAKYNNIAEYHEEAQVIASDYYIYHSTLKSMKIICKGASDQEINLSEVPVIQKELDRQYTLSDYGYIVDSSKILWVIYMECSRDMAWLEIADYVINDSKLLAQVNEDIERYLKLDHVPAYAKQMVKIETKLPF